MIAQIKSLSHRYSAQWAIRDINLNINEKGVFALLGSNGAGKSTTMNILCNVLTPTQGEIYINGINLLKNPMEAKRYIGFLPQQAPLYKDMTVREYLSYCALLRGISSAEIPSAVEVAMNKCGITHFADRIIQNLSGGYQQRAGIAQAIIHNPLLVILDEPTNGLDPNQILQVRSLIREIAQDRAVLISTHILPEVEAVCDYVVMIDHGDMVFEGPIGEFSHYLAPCTVLAIMYHAPEDAELLALPGVERIERLNRVRMRIHFHDSPNLTETIAREACRNNWGLKEISLETSSMDKVFALLSSKQQ